MTISSIIVAGALLLLPNLVRSKTESEMKNKIDASHNILSLEHNKVFVITRQHENIYTMHKYANIVFSP